MENLYPLRQKPDFKAIVESFGWPCDGTAEPNDMLRICEHVWTSHVELLMKELDAKDKEMEGLIDIHHANDAELESDRDKFAIGFARHMIYSAWEYDYREQRSHTVEEQLTIYKESLLNHKP